MTSYRRNKDTRILVKAKTAEVKKIARKEAKSVLKQNVESKFLQHVNTIGITNAMAWFGTSADIPQGDGNGQRNGDKIIPEKLKLDVSFTAGDATNFIRFMVVRWTPNDSNTIGNQFDMDKVLALGPTGNIDTNSQYLYENKESFDILFDQTYTLVQQADTHIRHFTKTLKLGKTPILYNPTLLTASGRIFIAYVSDSGVVSHPSMDISTTFWYTDA